MKVYLATSGEYSDYRVCHAFARREDAEAYPLGSEVKELELRDGPVEVQTWYALTWNPAQPDGDPEEGRLHSGNPWVIPHARDFDGDPGNIGHSWSDRGVLYVEGWNRERVLKVYSEQRAQHKAREAGL